MATMDAVQWMEYLAKQEATVKGALAGMPQLNEYAAQDAFRTLMQEWRKEVADRDAEIQRLRSEAEADLARINHFKTELEIAKDELKDLKANRRGIIGQAHSDRADLYAAQDRLEQMGDGERY